MMLETRESRRFPTCGSEGRWDGVEKTRVPDGESTALRRAEIVDSTVRTACPR